LKNKHPEFINELEEKVRTAQCLPEFKKEACPEH
jgi:hypothetical protein